MRTFLQRLQDNATDRESANHALHVAQQNIARLKHDARGIIRTCEVRIADLEDMEWDALVKAIKAS